MSRFIPSDAERPDLALLIPSYAGGGAERIALFLARTLAEAGLHVDLVVARRTGELRDEPLPGVTRVELGAVNEILAAPAWVRYLERVRPRCAMSMIHTANFTSGLGRLFVPEVPVIVNLRIALDCEREAKWWVRRWFGFGPERALHKRAARVVGVSKGLAEEAVEILALPRDRVLAIPNPRSSRETSPNVAVEHEPLFDKPVVLGVGRLTPQKDFSTLLRAFAQVTEAPEMRLVILGDGPERESLSRQAEALGLGARVFLPGFVPNPQAYMRRARVFVLSSRNEGFPGVLIEAMEADAPIVATDCHFGPREILDEGRFGRLVEVGDVLALAAALRAELAAPDIGPEARHAERADWMRQYDPEVITGRYLELIREVIEESERESGERSARLGRHGKEGEYDEDII
ncbi:MAG: glycosyltransferase [Polyangiales bacterium]